MWKVTCIIKGKEEEVVECNNPEGEINRFRFKDVSSNIVVTYGISDIVRRVYKGGNITKDVVEYPTDLLKSVDDYADALAFMNFVGNRKDYLPQVSGSTKKQRTRLLERRLLLAKKDSIKIISAMKQRTKEEKSYTEKQVVRDLT